jgi:hypothetical protein
MNRGFFRINIGSANFRSRRSIATIKLSRPEEQRANNLMSGFSWRGRIPSSAEHASSDRKRVPKVRVSSPPCHRHADSVDESSPCAAREESRLVAGLTVRGCSAHDFESDEIMGGTIMSGGTGLLVIWTDIAPEYEVEFNDWYDN